ncbi:MAG TPA: AbrB/MazE/SpoVT family DNA-binding domain-containing protein [Thermoanaerobaculia bacterium]|nr:AbrB/MazE/SpoVT family DNA-binding domain-containing protein [Thermoanaerobaculia bacterium]
MIAFRPDNFDAILGDAIAEWDDAEIERRRDTRHHASHDRHANLERIGGPRLKIQGRAEHRGAKGSAGIGHVEANARHLGCIRWTFACPTDGCVLLSVDRMSQTKISSKYQVVIPKDVRAGFRPGQKFQVIVKRGVITLIPDKPIASMRGFLRGMPTDGFREKKDDR